MRYLALTLCWLVIGVPYGLTSEMPEDMEAYLQRQGADREEKSLAEWMKEHGQERPENTEQPVDPLGAIPSPPPQPEFEVTPNPPQPTPNDAYTPQPDPFVTEKTQPALGPTMDWSLLINEEARPSPDATPAPQPLPFQPEKTEPALSKIPDGKEQPLAITLVHMLDGPSESIAAAGCPPSEPKPLKDDGIAPDTRASDSEHTAFVPLCPLGETTVRFFVEGKEVWSWDFSPDADAPALRVLRQRTGFSVDNGSPEDRPEVEHRVVASPETETTSAADESEEKNAGFWIGPSLVLISIGLGWHYWRQPTPSTDTATDVIETQSRQLEPTPPTLSPISLALAQVPSGNQSVFLDTVQDQRDLTYALALHHCKSKTVLLVADPENKKTYQRAFSKQDNVTWFNGKPLTGPDLNEALLELGEDIGVVLIEGTPAIAGNRKKDLQKLLAVVNHPVFLIQRRSAGGDLGKHYRISNGEWRTEEEV
jgi:hypothetical protein